MTEFEKYASLGRGISTNTLDRIIWVGCAIDDDVANIVQAQLLFLGQGENPVYRITKKYVSLNR